MEKAHIALNKNTIPGDKSALVPHGIRMGAPALTSRGFIESDFEQVAEFVHQGIQITRDLKAKCKGALCCESVLLLQLRLLLLVLCTALSFANLRLYIGSYVHTICSLRHT